MFDADGMSNILRANARFHIKLNYKSSSKARFSIFGKQFHNGRMEGK